MPIENKLSHAFIANVAWNFFGNISILLISFFATPFIVHKLNTDLYGIYVLVGAAMGYFGFLQLGLGSASIRYISQYLAQKDELKVRGVFWSCILVYSIVGLLVIFVTFFTASFITERFFKIPPDLKNVAIIAFKLGSIDFLVSLLYLAVSGIIRSLSKFNILNRIEILIYAVQMSLTIILLYLGYSLPQILVAAISVKMLGILLYWDIDRKYLPFLGRPLWETKTLIELLKFGGFVTVSMVLGPILTNIEKIFLTALRPVSSLTYYSIPASLIARLSVIPYSFATVLFPIFSSFQNSKDSYVNKELHYRSTLYIASIYSFFMVFFLIFGRMFLALWIGRDFAEQSCDILRILALSGLSTAIAYPSMTVLYGLGNARTPAVFHIVETLFYIPLAYAAIYKWGGVGAALAWFARVWLDAILLHKTACNSTGVSIISGYSNLLLKVVPGLIFCYISFWLLKGLGLGLLSYVNVLGIVMIFIIYFYLAWRWQLDNPGRIIIKSFLLKIFNR